MRQFLKTGISLLLTRPVMDKIEKLEIFKSCGLYVVTSEIHSKGRRDEDVLIDVAEGGCKIVQLRDKLSDKRRLYEKALRFKEITAHYKMLLIINDHLDIALAVEADGVHLGQEDLPVKAARKIAPELLIGVSTHNKDEIISAQVDGADYINIGPIFRTQTREGHTEFLGLEGLIELKRYAKIPFSVMGGIKTNNIPAIVGAGAEVIAMITEVTEAEDITTRVREILSLINNCKAKV